jgi:hypothetical protein
MSDQPDAGSLPELTPEQESEVRRLLAEARHDAPLPTDVADRLDTVLAGLTRDEPGSPGVAPVIDLAARRRRRNAAAVLAGAAAVIVAGFAIGQVIDVSSSSDDAGTSADSNASREGPAKEEAQGDSGAFDGGAESAPQATGGGQVLKLSSEHLQRDLDAQLHGYTASSGDSRTPGPAALSAIGCPPPAPANKFGHGEFFPALYDSTPAVLALRPPANGLQQADVLDCSTAEVLDSATITPR